MAITVSCERPMSALLSLHAVAIVSILVLRPRLFSERLKEVCQSSKKISGKFAMSGSCRHCRRVDDHYSPAARRVESNLFTRGIDDLTWMTSSVAVSLCSLTSLGSKFASMQIP